MRLSGRRRTALGALVVAIGVAWLFSATLFSSKVLGGEANLLFQFGFDRPAELTQPVNENTYDAFYVFHPDMLEARRQLRSLELPSWTDLIGGGEPLLATEQHASLFPLNWPMLALPFWQSLEWLAALKLFAAGLGMLLLLRELKLRREAAAFGAVSYAFSTYLIAWVEHPHVNSFVLIPWALLFAHRLARDGSPRSAALLAATCGASLLGGQPESSFLLGLITVPWFFVAGPGRRASALFAGAVATALAVGAVAWIPFAELASNATQLGRGGGSGHDRNWLLSFFMPELWGRPDKYEIAGHPFDAFVERTPYLGALPLMLAVGGLVARRPQRPQVFFAVASVLALGMVIHVPVYTHFVDNLPVFREVDLRRALVLCVLGGAVLGAFGVQALIDGGSPQRLRLLAGAGAVGLLPIVWLADHRDLLDSFGDAWHQLPVMAANSTTRGALQMGTVLRWSLLALACCALIAVVVARPRFAGPVAAAAVVLTLADLVTMGRGYHPAIPEAWANPPESSLVRYLRTTLDHDRFGGYQNDLGPNVSERFEVRDARRHEQPVIERRQLLWQALGGEGVLQRNWWSKPNDRLSDMFAVKYMIGPTFAGQTPPGWKPSSAGSTLERTPAPARAWLTYDWTPANGMKDALAAVQEAPARDDRARPVIEGVAPSGGEGADFFDTVTTGVTFLRDARKSVRIRATAAEPAQLILADTYYPGWHAKVDGKSVDIHPANVAFRAVAVPPGTHTIEFDYKPLSVRIGALLSLLGIAAIVAALVVTRNRPARTPRSSRQP